MSWSMKHFLDQHNLLFLITCSRKSFVIQILRIKKNVDSQPEEVAQIDLSEYDNRNLDRKKIFLKKDSICPQFEIKLMLSSICFTKLWLSSIFL
jgi:hypothetical protein